MNLESHVNNEIALIECLKQGERLAFDEIVGCYRQRGLAIAYNLLGNLEDAQDVLQEAFIKVYFNAKNFKGKSTFLTWFYRLVVNCSIDFLRKRKRSNKFFIPPLLDTEGKELEAADLRYEPAQVVINAELSRNLEMAIANLPERQRLCFVLKHQNGLNNQEISGILKCRLATVKVHLFRAVRNLQANLTSYIAK